MVLARKFGRWLHRMAGGEASPPRSDTVSRLLGPGAMVSHLRETLASPRYRPPLLPALAAPLLELTRDPEASLVDARHLLERDPLLAARVLQVAQSALYSRGGPVQSLEGAISRLGLDGISEVFLQTVAATRIFRVKGYEQPMNALLHHSTLTAHVARLTCRRAGLSEQSAFTCGLLHDAGMAVGLLIFADPDVTRWAPHNPPDFERLAEALELVHEEASMSLAEAWSLGPEVRTVVGHHHSGSIGGQFHALAAAVCVADWVASEAGAPFGNEVDAGEATQAASLLGLSSQVLAELSDQAREILAQL